MNSVSSLLIAVGTAGLALGCVASSRREACLFALFTMFPSLARYVAFVRLRRDDGQILYLLGTMHGRHLRNTGFSLLHVQAAIERLRPDLLLVEVRSEEFERGNIGEGPVEMVFAALVGQRLRVEVGGIDWWAVSMGRPGSAPDEREDRMADRVLHRIGGHRTTFVLVGYSHVRELLKRFRRHGFIEIPFTVDEKRAILRPTTQRLHFPPGMARALEAANDHLGAIAERETNRAWKRAFERVIRSRQELLEVIQRTGEGE